MANPDASVVRCQCGVKLRVPPNAAGKRVRCPKCGYRIEIPADGAPVAVQASAVASAGATARPPRKPAATDPARQPAKRPPAPPPVHDEGDSLLDDFMELESTATTTSGPDLEARQKNCPSCNGAMPADAKTCVMCGWEAGKASAAPAVEPVKAARARKLAIGGGKFALGCVLSAAGAFVGAAIWYGVAVAAYLEIGYIAWAVGLLAGFGMLWGYGKQDFVAALVATLMALGAIFGAKLAIYDKFYGDMPPEGFSSRIAAVHWADRQCHEPFDRQGLPDWAPVRESCEEAGLELQDLSEEAFLARESELKDWATRQRWEDPAYARAILTLRYAYEAGDEDEDFEEDEDWDQAQADADWHAEYAEAAKRVDALPHEQRLAEARQYENEDEQLVVKFGEALESLAKETNGGFFSEMFGPIDALFVLLALGTAMKIGGGHD